MKAILTIGTGRGVWAWLAGMGMAGLVACGAAEPGAGAAAEGSDPASQTAPESDTGAEAETEPLVLRGQSGVVIRGRMIAAETAIELHACSDITLIDCDLGGVTLSGCSQVRIVNCYLHDTPENAVYLDDCDDVLIQGNRIERVRTGVLAHRSTGVRVIGNYCEDVLGPMPGGQFVQFDKVTGPGNVIARNRAVNFRGLSQPEDMISIYKSHGTEDSPIWIEENFLFGDPVHGSAGKSESGSGIMLGDGGGSWQMCVANRLYNPGQAGIGVASGENITVQFNVVLGEQSGVSNVGLYVWEQYGEPAGRVVVFENIVAWMNAEGQDNPFWDGGGFAEVDLANNTFGGQALLESIGTPARSNPTPEPPFPYEEPAE